MTVIGRTLTLSELLALPDGARIMDKHFDFGVIRGPHIEFPETAPILRTQVARKWGPVILVEMPDGGPSPAPGQVDVAALVAAVERAVAAMQRLAAVIEQMPDGGPPP